MSYSENPYPSSVWGTLAAQAHADERADFIRKTYMHLGGAVLAFIGIDDALTGWGWVGLAGFFAAFIAFGSWNSWRRRKSGD